MRILITGGAGFIGSHVAEYYAKKGEEVTLFDNLSRADILEMSKRVILYNWSYLKDNYGNVKLVNGDVRDFKEVKKATRDADVIVHAAAQVAVTTSVKDPRTDFEVNALGTFNVLESAREAETNPSIVYCSTNKVYGTNVNKIPVKEEKTRYCFADGRYENGIPEDFPIDLCEHTPYGCSKLAGDLYVQDYARVYGLKTGVFRMSCIYGERQFGVEDQGWVAWFVIATLKGKPITIYGDGKQVRDVLHVSDLVQAYDAFIKSNLKHEVFNIGGGPENTLSLLELLSLLEEITGKRTKISFAEWRPGDQKVYVSNISKAQEKMNWKPKIGPRKGTEKLVRWAQENIETL
jgi:CDP-paratose 2-epimerase